MDLRVLSTILVFGIIWECESLNNRISDDGNYISLQQVGTLENFFEKFETTFELSDGVSIQYHYNYYKKSTPNLIEIQSPNYPNSYPVDKKTIYPISIENSTGIEIFIHTLDIDPEKDFLKFSSVNEEEIKRPVLILTGNLKSPIKFRILNTKRAEVEFGAYGSANHQYKGFIFTYTLYGDLPAPVIRPPDPAIPFDRLESIRTALIIHEEQQTNSTWQRFRSLLCQATNSWISNGKFQLENCKTDNVTFKSIHKCPNFWPNYSACIHLTFAISLFSTDSQWTTDNPILAENVPNIPAALTKSQLQMMWNDFAKDIFRDAGIFEYKEPDIASTVGLWMGVGLAISLVTLITFLIVCRIRVFKDYVNWSKDDDDRERIIDKHQEIDITMIPSPEQTVPDVIDRYAKMFQAPSTTFVLNNESNGNPEHNSTVHGLNLFSNKNETLA